MGRPADKTIKAVVEYLNNELDLSIYGQGADLETGQWFEGLMNYDAEEVIKLRKLVKKDAMWSPGDDR